MGLSWEGGWVGHWVWMGVSCPCPPVRNDIVTPRHLFLRTRNFTRGFVGPLVREHELKSWKMSVSDTWVNVGVGVGVWIGVGYPCPPVRNDIVTPRHLFSLLFPFVSFHFH